jgi:N-acetylneuraminic acid mutarotase
MKSCMFMLIVATSLSFTACGGGSAASTTTLTTTTTTTTTNSNQWTWMSGANVVNQPGTYGAQGTAAAGNVPSGRNQAVSWTDAAGNFWLFGGQQAPTATSDIFLNDLWKYSAGQWTWMSGSSAPNQAGIYGTLGVAAAGNVPGARCQAVSWTDSIGNFWLFGGIGLDSTGSSQYLNDLWKYSGGEWTWMGGSNVGEQSGVYGTLGTAAPGNFPGARALAVSWTDTTGNFWLFGGSGVDANGASDYLNDLWKYSGGEWTWMSGANVIDQVGVYGTLGTAGAGNVPGSRYEAVGWTDASGNLWLFGGGAGPDSQFNPLNDLWKYSAGQWTWMSGSNSINQLGSYGTEGMAAATNAPGARVASATWIDASGNLWLFGGDGYDSGGRVGILSDLWKYSAGAWTWAGGPNVGGQAGVYGMEGTAASGNIPGARFSAVGWTDASGDFWLFGGNGNDSTGTLGDLNDLWKYGP